MNSLKARCIVKRNKLIDFRNSNNMTQKEIAELLDISEVYYMKIEHGDRNASYNFITKFKEKFPDADIEKLFFRRAS